MKSYRDVLYKDYSSNFGDLKDYEETSQWSVYDRIYPDLLPASESPKIADMGCGKGEWLRWLKGKGFKDLVGFDHAVEDIPEDGHEGIQFRSANILAMTPETGADFDLVHAKDVAEHLDQNELVDFLHSSRAILKSGGKIVLLTFNAQSPLSNITRYGDFTHEIGLTPTSARQLLRACGYKDVEVKGCFHASKGLSGSLRILLGTLTLLPIEFWAFLRHGGKPKFFSGLFAPDLVISGVSK